MVTTDETCDESGCDRVRYRRLWCSTHYQRFMKYGDASFRMHIVGVSDAERLEFVGWRITDAGCWEWRGAKFQSTGYGMISGTAKPRVAHRVAYEAWVGSVPDGLVVRHKCDNRPCINPAHLETGTQADNVRDMHDRGRAQNVNGVNNPQCKLTVDQVSEIRRLGETDLTHPQIAAMFGISRRQVGNIVARRAWRSLA